MTCHNMVLVVGAYFYHWTSCLPELNAFDRFLRMFIFAQKVEVKLTQRRLMLFALLSFLWSGNSDVLHSAEKSAQENHTKTPLSFMEGGSKPTPGFTKMAPHQVGIHWRNDLSPSLAEQNRVLENGSGVAAGDVNGDGHCDLYFATIEGANHLHLNNGDWTFREVDLAGGAGCAGQASTGVLLVDVEGDEDLDLLVNGIGTGTRLFINDGHGTFTEKVDSGLAHLGGAMSMSMADADQDGDLDLYVTHYRENTWKDLPPGVTPRIVQKDNRSYALPEDRFLAIDNGPGVKPGITEVGEPDRFYLNNGDGTFSHQPWLSGRFRDEDGKALTEIPRYWGLSVMFRDLNGDLLPDLIVCNDFAYGEDQVWINQGGAIFHQLSNKSMRQSSWSSMAVDVADINRDGHDDFFIVEMLSRFHSRRQTQRANYETGIQEPSIAMELDRPQTQRNTLFLNRGDQTFAEIARLAGLDSTEWSWGTVFMDVDLDGWDDLLVANGNNHDLLDGDSTIAAVIAMRSAPRGQTPKTLLMYPSLHTANLAFRNKGDLSFEEVSHSWGFDEVGISQGMCLADLDRDGDLDLILNNLQGTPSIYQNHTSAPRVSVRLQGLGKNSRGVGTRVRLVLKNAGREEVQSQTVISGGRYLSSDDSIHVFAMTEHVGGARLEIEWPTGMKTHIDGVESGHEYILLEPTRSNFVQSKETQSISSNPLFESVPASQFDAKHLESALEGALNFQPLLPVYLDRSGPSLLVSDLNQDGDQDLVIGQGQGHRTTVIQGKSISELGVRLAGFEDTELGDQTDLVAWKETNGFMRLAISISNMSKAVKFGLESTRSQPSVLIYQQDGDEMEFIQSLPGQRAVPGSLELIDYDSDGDMDLFVGGRMNPGRYPEAAISRLYQNQNGTFKLNLEQSRAWFDMGLVTDAESMDWDGDGDMDLLVACEWGVLRLWENQNGKFFEKTDEAQLGERKGIWSALEVADFDGDGDADVMAGNWGRNTDYQRFLKPTIRIYHGDLDDNGTYDLLESYFDEHIKQWVPARDLIALGNAFPFVRERHRTYAGMSKTYLDELFKGIAPLEEWVEINTLDSGILWNEGGKFRWQVLPVEAQFTPVVSLASGDFNGDDRLDIFIGQNYQSFQPEISRSDAGLGLVLVSDGFQQFKPLSSEESGILLFGEQSEAKSLDWNADGRMDLLVGQTAGDIQLFLQVDRD